MRDASLYSVRLPQRADRFEKRPVTRVPAVHACARRLGADYAPSAGSKAAPLNTRFGLPRSTS